MKWIPIAWLIAGIMLCSNVAAQNVNVFGDDLHNPGFIGIQAGISFPAGNYISDDPTVSGFALPGPGISAEGAWYFSDYFGLGFRMDYNQHFVATDKMENAYLAVLDENAEIEINYDGIYTIATAMAGIYATMPLNRWLLLNGKILYGPFLVKIPQYTLHYQHSFTFYDQTLQDNWTEINYASSDWQFSYLVGLGLRFNMGNTWSFNIMLDYSESYQEIEFEFYSEGVIYDELGNPNNAQGKQTTTFNQNFRYMLLQGGFSFYF